jgi:hypothetical protein
MYHLFILFLIISAFCISLGYIVRKKLFIQIGSLFLILIGLFVLSNGIPYQSGWSLSFPDTNASDPIFTQGNAWDNEMTGELGFSEIIDTQDYPYLSIMGEIFDDTRIFFYASNNGLNFYYCDRISATIKPTPVTPLINYADDGSLFSASGTDTGSPSNLVEGVVGYWELNDGGFLADVWVQYDLNGDLVAVTEYTMTVGRADRAPSHFQLQGWNGVSWSTIDTRLDVSWVAGVERTFSVDPALQDDFLLYRLLLIESHSVNRVRIDTVTLLSSETGTIYPKQYHIFPTVGARYVRLQSSDDVLATATITAKPSVSDGSFNFTDDVNITKLYGHIDSEDPHSRWAFGVLFMLIGVFLYFATFFNVKIKDYY